MIWGVVVPPIAFIVGNRQSQHRREDSARGTANVPYRGIQEGTNATSRKRYDSEEQAKGGRSRLSGDNNEGVDPKRRQTEI